MIRILDPGQVDDSPSLDEADKAIEEGLPFDSGRLDHARKAEDFYHFRNHNWLRPRREENPSDFAGRPKRYSRITRTVIRKLAEPLYSNGPTRTWEGDPERSAWLNQVYTQADANSRLMSADRAATLNHVAAIQVEATGDVDRPIRFWVWKGHEFVVLTRDGNPIEPWAIITIEQVPGKLTGQVVTRYRAWSSFERRTYLTTEHLPNTPPPKDARLIPEESGESPYPGIFPFVWVRAEPADAAFWEGGLAVALTDANEEADRRQSDLAQHIERYLNPMGFARNVPSTASFTHKPGAFVHLQTDPAVRAGDQGGQAELGYLQATLGVSDAWADIRAFLDSTLEELEVPLTVVRSDAATDLSGVAIVAKQMPLIDRTRGRQVQFNETEQDLAATTLAVYGSWYGDQASVAAAKDPKLVCLWPEPKIPLPTPDRDIADAWELDQGLTDPIEVLARRRGVTLVQAEELAKQIAERRKLWASIMGAKPEEQSPEAEAADDQVDGAPDDKAENATDNRTDDGSPGDDANHQGPTENDL